MNTWETYLVEHYRPGLSSEELAAWAARVRDTARELERETKAVRYVGATIVPADESMLCIVEAVSEQLVRDVYTRAEIPFERITVVVLDAAWSEWPKTSRKEKK
jgi:hypothetical protein